MKKEELKALKKTINDKINHYASLELVSVKRLSELLKVIHNLEYKDRKELREEYDKINEFAFSRNVALDEYDPDVYFNKKPSSKRTSSDLKNKDLVENAIFELFQIVESRFKFFPRNIFLFFKANENKKINNLLLYNHENEPFFLKKTKKEIKDSGSNCSIYHIDDFIKGVEDGELRNSNYVVFFAFKVKSNPTKYIDKLFNTIDGYFDVSQLKIEKSEEDVRFIDQLEKIKEEIEYIMMVEFINEDLDHHKLKVIKLLFGANKINQIHYKVNSKGFTDSCVISVQPFSNFENPQKYIVKIGGKNNSKLLSEEEKYRKYVETTDSSYGIEVKQTEECFAIRYHYATIDSKIESKSFGKILRSSKSAFPLDKRKSYIKKLFKTDTYERWDSTESDDKNINFSDYSDFVDLEKIENELAKIYDTSDVDKLEEVRIFQEVKKINLNGKSQVCHGDLHTENFFIDEKENAFLIDFGDVGEHHNIIDYAMLETSIKLNHTPNYIPNDTLYSIEEELLDESTFNENYVFKNTQRQDLIDIYSLVTIIRDLAYQKIDSVGEYFYALYMLSFRQIKYDDLNQLYAIEIAKKVGNKLIDEMS